MYTCDMLEWLGSLITGKLYAYTLLLIGMCNRPDPTRGLRCIRTYQNIALMLIESRSKKLSVTSIYVTVLKLELIRKVDLALS